MMNLQPSLSRLPCHHPQPTNPAPMATTPTPPFKQSILLAYRILLRAGLRAVHFKQPGRSVIISQLRRAFRDPRELRSFDLERVKRTAWFLKAAGEEKGLESKILKNLVRVRWER